MTRSLLCLLLLVPSVSLAHGDHAKPEKAADAKSVDAKSWGSAPTITSEPIALSAALEKDKIGTPVRVLGTPAKVCEKKGCWLTLKDGEREVRVTFKDYGFFVPKEIVGKKVVLEGTVKEEEVSEKDARHYAKDGGATKEELAKIKGSTKAFTMVATSVTLAE